MSNRVLLISGNFFPEPAGIGKYNGEMIDWLSKNGYSCTVITTFPSYPDFKVQAQYRISRFWFKKEIRQSGNNGSNAITIIRCPHYIPTSPTAFKRILADLTFSFFSFIAFFGILFTRKFDYVITVAPPFQLGILGIIYKNLRRAKFLYHIQDLQIDVAQALGMIQSSSLLKMLLALEKYIIKRADYVSTISPNMTTVIQRKSNRDVTCFPNWVDTNLFYPIKDNGILKLAHGFKPTDKIILYSGAIGYQQGLASVLYVAKDLEKFDDVKFVIAGSGPYKEQLISLQNSLELKNLTFLPLQTSSNYNALLNMADLHLVIQKKNASALMLPMKLNYILATGGIAIVAAEPGTNAYDVMNSADMGFIIEPENNDALGDAIRTALTKDLSAKKYTARAYAETSLARDAILSEFATNVLTKNIVEAKKRKKPALELVFAGESTSAFEQEQEEVKFNQTDPHQQHRKYKAEEYYRSEKQEGPEEGEGSANNEIKKEQTSLGNEDINSPREVLCYFQADIEAEVLLNRAVTIAVTVSRELIEMAAGATADRGTAGVDKLKKIFVEVIPKSNFISLEDVKTYQEIDVPQPNEPKQLFFYLRAIREGVGEISIIARQGQSPVVLLKLKPKVVRNKNQPVKTV